MLSGASKMTKIDTLLEEVGKFFLMDNTKKIDTLLTVDSEKFRELMWSWLAGTNLKVNLFPLIAIGGALFLCKFQI